MSRLLLLLLLLAGVWAGPDDVPCTTGSPTTTAGYVINYSRAAPTRYVAGAGYEPDHAWSSSHVLGSYVSSPVLVCFVLSLVRDPAANEYTPPAVVQTYGVPAPLERGFAFAQFKCQFKCNSFDSASFFVEYGE